MKNINLNERDLEKVFGGISVSSLKPPTQEEIDKVLEIMKRPMLPGNPYFKRPTNLHPERFRGQTGFVDNSPFKVTPSKLTKR